MTRTTLLHLNMACLRTAGSGVGIDRMIMLFTNCHTIRDVIMFPAMRTSK